MTALPDDWLYRYLPSAGWGILSVGVASVLAAALVALPRVEALDGTSSRSLIPLRGTLTVALYAACWALGAVCAAAAGSRWFLVPVACAALIAAGLTLAASVIIPSVHVAAVGTAYVMACCLVSRGTQWWDLMLAPPSAARVWLVIAAAAVAGATFTVRGARFHRPVEEL